MLKKTIKYTDYNGIEREEDFYFNLTKAELTVMDLSEAGGLRDRLVKIIKAQDVPEIIKLFIDIIDRAYGVKSPDGKRFIKNQEVLDEFRQTEAYSQLFMELSTDAEAGSAFVNGILPADLVAEIEKDNAGKVVSLPSADRT